MGKNKIQVFLLEWGTTDASNADISIVLTDNTAPINFFEGAVPANFGTFSYSIDETIYDQTSGANFFDATISTPVGFKNGDSSPIVDFTTSIITYDSTGQKALSTNHYTTLSPNTDTLDTNHIVTLDRTEFYTNGAEIFWESNTTTGLTDVTNPEYIYSSDMRSEYCVFPDQTPAGDYLKVKRDTKALHEGVDGTIRIDTTMYTESYGTDMSVYISENDTSVGVLLGRLSDITSRYNLTRTRFRIPTDLMHTMSDASFAGMTMSLTNDHTTDSRWLIYDSVFEYSPLTKGGLDTTHSSLVNDATTPTIWRDIQTTHKARLKKGAYYVIEYYTLDDWWDFDV